MEIKVYNNVFENKFSTFEYNPDKPLVEQIEENLNVDFYKDTLVECYDSETGKTFYAPIEDEEDSSSIIIVANGQSVDKDYIPQEHDLVSVFFTPASSSGGKSGSGSVIGAVLGAIVGVIAVGIMIYTGGATAPIIIQALSVFASCVGLGYAIGTFIDMKNQNIDNKTNKLNGAKEGASSPDVRGAENTSVLNDNFPFVIGKHLVTPRVIGDPVTTYSGTDGEDAYIRTLLVVGYAPMKLTDFKLGDFWLAYNRDMINSEGEQISHDTIINGLLRGYSTQKTDDGDILDYWKHNDISLEIIQQNPNAAVDYGTLYEYAADDQSINANVLYIADKQLNENIPVSYKGAQFPSKFRTNGVFFTTPCPRKFTVNIQFPSGLYASYTKTTTSGSTSITDTIYGTIPLWMAIQWRIVSTSNASSNSNGYDYDQWNNISFGNMETFTNEKAAADKSAHLGNDLSGHTLEDIYQGWLGKDLCNFGNYSGEDHISEIRLSKTITLTQEQCKQVIADTNPSKMIEIRVIRVSPNYMNQISTDGLPDDEGMRSYSDLTKVISIVTETFDEQELRINDTLVPIRPLSERDMRKFTLVAIKAKADASGYIINQLKKVNCVAESFSPYWDSAQKKMLPEGVTKKIKYYGYYDEHNNKVNRSDDAIEREITKAQYEEGRQEGYSWYQEDAGSTFEDVIKAIVFNNVGTHNGRPCTILTPASSIFNNNSVASGFMLACVGPQNGTVALGYDEVNILTIGDWAEKTAALKDGTTFNSDTVYNGVQYLKGDEVPLRMEANGYVCAGIKLEGLLEKLAVAGRALWCVDETGKIKIVMDRPCDYVKGVISAQNCISSSNVFSYEKQPAGLFISFSDENDGYDKNQVYCWSDGNSISNYHGEVEPYNIDFVTNPYQIWSIGRYMLAYRILMKEMLTRKIGVEGNTYSIGDVVMIQSEDLLIGDTSGRIQEVLEDNGRIYGFITDAPFEFEGVLDTDGNSTQGVTILQPGYLGKSKVVTLPIAKDGHPQVIGGVTYTQKKGTTNLILIGTTDPNHTYYGVMRSGDDPSDGDVIKYNMKEGDICMFGVRDKISAPYRIIKIKPEKDGGFSETLLPYNEDLYNSGKMLPAFQSYITNPPVEDMLVSLSDVPTNIKDLNDSRKGIQNSINMIVNGGANIGSPDTVTNINAVAGMSNIAITWAAPVNNGLRNSVKCYYVWLSKNEGLTWELIGRVYKSSFEYEYKRANLTQAVNRGPWAPNTAYDVGDTITYSGTKYVCDMAHTSGEEFDTAEKIKWIEYDGYMEREEFADWRVKVITENQAGQQSGDSAFSQIDVSGYGTFKPSVPQIISCEASRDDIKVNWTISFQRQPYATNLFKAYLYKKVTHDVGEWAPDTVYDINDLVKVTDTTTDTVVRYYCTTAHTSGSEFDAAELANWSLYEGIPVTIISNEYGTYTFNRKTDGYPEISDLSGWAIKIVCYNTIYGETTKEANWSVAGSIGTRDYGTWALSKPIINAKVTDRTIILNFYLTPTASNVIPYGDIRYRVYIKKTGVNEGYCKPALTLNPYAEFDVITKQCIHDNEQNYKDTVIMGEWQPGYDYHENSIVSESGTMYKCTTAHYSGATFDVEEQAYWAESAWQPQTVYTTNEIVTVEENNEIKYYSCKIAHTSGSTFNNVEKEKWEEYQNYVISYDTFVQTLPLEGQGLNQLKNTSYDYKIIAFNEAGDSPASDDATITALCTNIRDIVKANQDYKELYISDLSVLSANIGAILQGSLGASSNLWDLSTFVDDNGRQHYEGRFRVGDENEYLLVDPILDEFGMPTGKFKISFKMGSFEVTTQMSKINGELIVQKDENSLDRTRITPEGTFYEHRGSTNAESEWIAVAKQETRGLMTQSVYSYDSLVITNMSIAERRALGHDVGKTYLSANAICYHFDTDDETAGTVSEPRHIQLPMDQHLYDHKGNTLEDNGGSIEYLSDSDSLPRLVDESDNTSASPIDFKPAILAFSPYSEIAKSLYGGYKLVHPLGNNLWTVDFWIEYMWAEDQTLFDVGNEGDRIQILIAYDEPKYNSHYENDDPPYDYGVMYEDLPVYNVAKPGEQYIYHTSGTFEESFILSEKIEELYGETFNFNPNTWLHAGFVLTNDKILFYVDVYKIEFNRHQLGNTPGTAIFNTDKNSFCLDELYIDTVSETFESFRQSSLDNIPWGNIPYTQKNFILDVKDLSSFYTNIFQSQTFADAVESITHSGSSCYFLNSNSMTGDNLVVGGTTKIMFTADITGPNISTPFVINYNGVDIPVKQPTNSGLADIFAKSVSSTYIYFRNKSRLDLVYDGVYFVLSVTDTIESGNMNPVTSNAIANSNAMPVDSVASNNMHSVTSNAVADALGYLVWENTDPQEIGDNVTFNYDRPIPNGFTRIKVECGNVLPGLGYVFYTDCLIGKSNYLSLHFTSAQGVEYAPNRIIDQITTTSFRVGICRFYKSDVGFSNATDRIIPLRIWAIK